MNEFTQIKSTPKELSFCTGWVKEINRCYENGEYAVLVRTINTDWGKVRHAAIRNITGNDILWNEKQKIKNMIFGEHKTAIEVFPKVSDLVNSVNMYHLWVLPVEFNLPFSLRE